MSFSTSSCEYSRVPFGERCGSISPRASYMRSVCGCICASSAAIEIMNTPRPASTATRVTRVSLRRAIAGLLGSGGSAVAARSARRRSSGGEQLRARVAAVERLRQLLGGGLLVLAQLVGHVDHEAVAQVAALRRRAAVQLRRALAAQALDGSVRRAGLDAQRLRPVERRHLHVGAAERLGGAQRELDLEVLALAREDGRRRDVRDQGEVAGPSAAAARLAPAGGAEGGGGANA